MPKQAFTINCPPGMAGDLYGMTATNTQRLSFFTEEVHTAYGLGVSTGAKNNSIKLGPEGSYLLGITLRNNELEAAKRPSDGSVGIPENYPQAVLVSGPINILAMTDVPAQEIGVNKQGQFGVGGEFTPVKNVKVIEGPLKAGEVGAVMVNVYPEDMKGGGGGGTAPTLSKDLPEAKK